jgi:hypothetical protein
MILLQLEVGNNKLLCVQKKHKAVIANDTQI